MWRLLFLANGAQYFFEEKGKTQRGRKAAAPLHTPRAFFKEFLVVDKGRVLTCVCMLGYWMWDAVPIWFLYASVLDVERCADLFLYIVFFGTGQDVHSLLFSVLCG